MAYRFAVSYLNQYPAEKVGPSLFACDETIRNAKFESSLRPLAMPRAEMEKPIFDALDTQKFTLHLDLVNTAIQCIQVSVMEEVEAFFFSLTDVSCIERNGTVSIRAWLTQHTIALQAVLRDIQLVGGVRVGLSGPGNETKLHTLQKLNFTQAFFSDSAETLSQHATLRLVLTKVSQYFSHTSKKAIVPYRSSMKRSLCLTVIPSSPESGIRHSPTARARCSSMLLVMPPLPIGRRQD